MEEGSGSTKGRETDGRAEEEMGGARGEVEGAKEPLFRRETTGLSA